MRFPDLQGERRAHGVGCRPVLALAALVLAQPGLLAVGAEKVAPDAAAGHPALQTSKGHALILVGLPGDEEHEKLFATVTRAWRDWLTGPLGFAAADVRVLFGRDGKQGLAKGAATRAAVEREVAALKQALRPDDRLWVFVLGHADHDGERAAFHLPGPDLRAEELGQLFAGISCREQVFWMTTSASGWFLRPLSAKGRIVVAATAADEESNETEFPQALAAVAKLPLARLDSDKDGKVSVLELYRHTVAEVEARFAADKRVPTEHAQLDDNGDGVGTEDPLPDRAKDKKPTAVGRLAARTFLPLKGKE
jgi:hypothetical protein